MGLRFRLSIAQSLHRHAIRLQGGASHETKGTDESREAILHRLGAAGQRQLEIQEIPAQPLGTPHRLGALPEHDLREDAQGRQEGVAHALQGLGQLAAEAVLAVVLRPDQMRGQRHLGGAHGPDMQVVNICYTSQI